MGFSAYFVKTTTVGQERKLCDSCLDSAVFLSYGHQVHIQISKQGDQGLLSGRGQEPNAAHACLAKLPFLG